jgi:hypothetical protein
MIPDATARKPGLPGNRKRYNLRPGGVQTGTTQDGTAQDRVRQFSDSFHN